MSCVPHSLKAELSVPHRSCGGSSTSVVGGSWGALSPFKRPHPEGLRVAADLPRQGQAGAITLNNIGEIVDAHGRDI